MPAKIMNRRIAIAMADALKMDMKDTCRSVRGILSKIPRSVAMTEKTTVHWEWSDKVLSTLAAVRTGELIVSYAFLDVT